MSSKNLLKDLKRTLAQLETESRNDKLTHEERVAISHDMRVMRKAISRTQAARAEAQHAYRTWLPPIAGFVLLVSTQACFSTGVGENADDLNVSLICAGRLSCHISTPMMQGAIREASGLVNVDIAHMPGREILVLAKDTTVPTHEMTFLTDTDVTITVADTACPFESDGSPNLLHMMMHAVRYASMSSADLEHTDKEWAYEGKASESLRTAFCH